MDLGDAFVKPFIYGNHPVGKFLQGSVDQAVGHLAVEGIGHRPGDGGKGIGIAAQGDGKGRCDGAFDPLVHFQRFQAISFPSRKASAQAKVRTVSSVNFARELNNFTAA